MDVGRTLRASALKLIFVASLGVSIVAPAHGQLGLDQPAGTREVEGRAYYEKVPVTASGLDAGRSRAVPIREAAVAVLDRLTGEVVFTTRTGSDGSFAVQVPAVGAYRVRVLSQLVSSEVAVRNNSDSGRVYSVERDLPGEGLALLLARDTDRVSGAFNILEVLRAANAFLRALEPGIEIPTLTVFWSPDNGDVVGNWLSGEIGSTYFDDTSGVAFVLGDRATDSDEFDDAVLLHEYAHLLAKRFSRDDSMGGPHVPGDVLDPRVAWSEGWANFFSSLVRSDPVYRDTFGADGSSVLEYDLEDNLPIYPGAGYWGEASVHRILWDLFDENRDLGDAAALDSRLIWRAFRALSGESFVYLVDFLDRLSRLEPSQTSSIEQTTWSHFIDYASSADSTVLGPFPKLTAGSLVSGEIDSWTRQRANLARSAHLYTFDTAGGAVSVQLEITGLGPAGNPMANDLDLVLMDAAGRELARSDSGFNGEAERILAFLPAGTYVVEIRSFYLPSGSSELSFNSGAYRLEIQTP